MSSTVRYQVEEREPFPCLLLSGDYLEEIPVLKQKSILYCTVPVMSKNNQSRQFKCLKITSKQVRLCTATYTNKLKQYVYGLVSACYQR
jgi:hypothetical protein